MNETQQSWETLADRQRQQINDILFVWTDTIIFAATEKNKCNLQKCGNFLIVSDFVFWFFFGQFWLARQAMTLLFFVCVSFDLT